MSAVLIFAACEKPVDEDRQRDIFYTVSENASLSIIGGDATTVHLATEAEWEELLDRFCNEARNGEQVMFCSRQNGTQQAKGKASESPSSISTSNRDELKAWMKEMEKSGKTVIVTYDDGNGTWNGMAYVNLASQDVQAEMQTLTGELAFIPTPALSNPTMGGLVWALNVDDDTTLIITIQGMMLWFDTDTPDGNMEMLQGYVATISGLVSQHTDLNGNTFLSIDMNPSDDGIYTF